MFILFKAVAFSELRALMHYCVISDARVLSFAKNISGGHRAPDLELSDGEIILDIYGTTTTKPVLQHIGTSTWPG